MPNTESAPGTTVDISGGSPTRNVTIGESSVYGGLLVTPSTGIYGNGVVKTGAAHGDSNTGEAGIEQIEIPTLHPQSNTPYDVSTAFSTADPAIAVRHIVGKEYWLKGSSLTASLDDKLVCVANGLVGKETAHTSTPLAHHTWRCTKAVSSGTWTKGVYLGLTPIFTA